METQFEWKKKYTTLVIEGILYRKNSSYKNINYFHCTISGFTGSCKIEGNLLKATRAEIINIHDNHPAVPIPHAYVFEKSLEILNHEIQIQIELNPAISAENIKAIIEDKLPEAYGNCDNVAIGKAIKKIQKDLGYSDWYKAATSLQMIEEHNSSFLKSLGIIKIKSEEY